MQRGASEYKNENGSWVRQDGIIVVPGSYADFKVGGRATAGASARPPARPCARGSHEALTLPPPARARRCGRWTPQ